MWFFCFNSNIRCIFDALAFVVAVHFIALHTLGWITRQPKAIDFKHESKIQQGRRRESESERKQLLSTIFTIIIFYFQLVCFLCTFWTLHSCSRCKIIVHTWSDEIYRNFYHSLFSLPFFRVACGFFRSFLIWRHFSWSLVNEDRTLRMPGGISFAFSLFSCWKFAVPNGVLCVHCSIPLILIQFFHVENKSN